MKDTFPNSCDSLPLHISQLEDDLTFLVCSWHTDILFTSSCYCSRCKDDCAVLLLTTEHVVLFAIRRHDCDNAFPKVEYTVHPGMST